MFFWKKERQIEQAIDSYLQETEQAVATFEKAMARYFEEGLTDRFGQLVELTHEYESAADDQRRQIERAMYRKELIPESRGDVLGMLEALDLVPNQCESVLYQIWTQQLMVPPDYIKHIRELVGISIEAHKLLCQTVRDLFKDPRQVGVGAQRIDEKEGQCDHIERAAIIAIFRSDLEKVDMILLRDLILAIGAISDRAENAADRLNNIAVKRYS